MTVDRVEREHDPLLPADTEVDFVVFVRAGAVYGLGVAPGPALRRGSLGASVLAPGLRRHDPQSYVRPAADR